LPLLHHFLRIQTEGWRSRPTGFPQARWSPGNGDVADDNGKTSGPALHLQEGIMAETGFPHHRWQLDRRRFLTAAAAATAAFGPVAAPRAEPVEIVRAGPRQRPEGDIEAWNVGLITAHRPELTAAQNRGRMGELRADIGNRFGLYQVRGRYVPEPGAEPLEENAFLLFGSTDDSGNLKGFLRKFGRKFGQEAVIWKGYYRDVLLFALKDLPTLSLANGEIKNLGRFQANVIGQYHALLARGVRGAAGQWAGLGIWTQPSFFNRVSGLCCLTSNGPE
jgi:hypothetical protein